MSYILVDPCVLTSRLGERRIRVITLALPTTSNLSEVFASADQVALTTYLANKAVERSLTHKLEDSRDLLFKQLMDILITYKSSMTAAGAGASAQLAISDNMKMLPLLILGLLKNVCFSLLIPLPIFRAVLLGWYPAKRTNSSRYSCLFAGAVDVPAVATAHTVHSPDILLLTQHAPGGEKPYPILDFASLTCTYRPVRLAPTA